MLEGLEGVVAAETVLSDVELYTALLLEALAFPPSAYVGPMPKKAA